MRILMVNAYGYVTSGADRHCFALADALREQGHEVAFVTTASEQNVVGVGRFVPLVVTHWSRDRLSASARLRVAARALWNPDAAEATASMLDSFRPDVVHSHKLYVQLSVAPVVVAARSRVPVVQTLHDYEFISASPIDHEGHRFDRDDARLSYRALNTGTFAVRRTVHRRRVSAWVAVSHYLAQLHRRRGIEAAVLPNFVDRPDDEIPLGFDQRRGAVVIGWLDQYKGIGDALELAKRAPWLPITIVGMGPMAERVRALSESLPNLSYPGFVEPSEVFSLLRSSRLTLIPSKWQEPAGLVALESMSTGTPIVAYESGGLAEYLRDSGAGRITKPNVDALIEGSRGLYEDEAAWSAHSASGRRAAESTYTADAYVDRLEAVYAEAIERRRSP